MIKITGELIGVDAVLKSLEGFKPDQVRKIMKQAAIQTAYEAIKAEKDEMNRSIDRPKPFTRNAMYVDKGQSGGSYEEVAVRFRESGAKANWAGHYLLPQVHGGGRPFKRYEKALHHTFPALAGHYLLPTQFTKLDAFGNIHGGWLTRLLSNLRADLSGTQNKGNGTRRTRNKKFNYFVVKDGVVYPTQARTTLASGIYEKHSAESKPVMVLHLADRVTFKKRFDFYGLAARICAKVFPQKLSELIARKRKT